MRAVFGPAEARQFVGLLGELVVICQLLVFLDMSAGHEDNMGLSIYLDYIGVAIRITTVIQIPRLISVKSGVNDMLSINTEQVAIADAQQVIIFLALVRQRIADFLTDILYNDVFRFERLTGE